MGATGPETPRRFYTALTLDQQAMLDDAALASGDVDLAADLTSLCARVGVPFG